MYQITKHNTVLKPQLINIKLLTKLKKLKRKKNNIKNKYQNINFNSNDSNIIQFIEDNIYYILFIVIFGLGLYYRYKLVQEERNKILKNNQK